jgi:PIN domain nuclease of toxin-antitoxin system
VTVLLLDTHVVLWAALAPERLGVKAKGLIEANTCLVSTISAQEIARLCATGKLTKLKAPLNAWLAELRAQLAFEWAEATVSEAIESYALPDFDHKDPCDRLIVAAARCRSATLMTADELLLPYAHLNCVDARR